MNSISRSTLLTLAAGLAVAQAARAQNSNWTSDVNNALWSVGGNWDNGIPNGVTSEATFGNVITADRTVDLNQFATLVRLTFDSAKNYRIVTNNNRTLRLGALDVKNTHGNASQIVEPTIIFGAANVAFTVDSTADVGLKVRKLTGDGGLTKKGAGTMSIRAICDYTGDTRVEAGKLILDNSPTLPSGTKLKVDGGATLEMSGVNQTVAQLDGAGDITGQLGKLTVNQAANTEFSGKFGAGMRLVKQGNGTLKLSGNNSHDLTEVSAGKLELGSNTAIPDGSGLQVNTMVEMNGFNAKPQELSGVGEVKNSAAGASDLTIGGGYFSGMISGKINFSVKGTANSVFKLDGDPKTFTGTQMIESGTLQYFGTNDDLLPSGRKMTIKAAGTLDLNGRNQLFTGLEGAGKVTNAHEDPSSLGVRVNAGDTSTFDGRITGDVIFTKVGPGTFVMKGASDPTNLGFVNGGTLQLDPVGGGAATFANKINVLMGTLTGNGRVGGLVTVDPSGVLAGKLKLDNGFENNGGKVAPGYSAGVITSDGPIAFSNGGRYAWELSSLTTDGAGENYDLLNVTAGQISISDDSKIILSFLGDGVAPAAGVEFWQNAHEWTVINVADAAQNPNSAAFSTIVNGQFDNVGTFSCYANSDGDVVIDWTPVPAPSTALVLLGMAGVSAARRRK